MALVTLSTLRTRIRQRTDQEHGGSDFVTDSELTQLINTSYAELYGELIRAGLHVAELTYDVTADGSAAYDLPTYYSIVGVFESIDGHNRRLQRHSVRHRLGTAELGPARSYRINNGQLELFPKPTSGTYTVVYVPEPNQLSSDSDTLDGVLGWEEYVVLDVAIKIYIKEESDPTMLMRERERLIMRIREEATAAEFTESWVVENVRAQNYYTEDMRPYRGIRGLR